MKDERGTMKDTINNESRMSKGFSLLEILVAMAILSVIILTLSTVFNQSSLAWDSGLAKVEKSMEGRIALNLMANELRNAVAGPDFLEPVSFGSGGMAFNSMVQATDGEHAVRFIEYSGQINRKATKYQEDYSYPGAIVSDGLLLTAEEFTVEPDSGWSSGDELPASVKLTIKMQRTTKTAVVSVTSAGPNGQFNDDDDVSSVERE